jgi:MFS family permease
LHPIHLYRLIENGGNNQMDIITPLLNIILGIILLTMGKKLYWLLVAVVGFVIGLALATQYVQLDPPWLIYIVAFGAGVIGAVLGFYVQKLAIALVGFLIGGYGALYLAGLLGIKVEPFNWMAFVIGGIVGLLLVASIFDWSLYILSAWAGSTLVTRTLTEGVGLNETLGLILFFILFVVGMIIQAGIYREKPKPAPVEEIPAEQPAKKKK